MPSLAPFGQAVSEEKIFSNISQSEKRIILGSHVYRPNGNEMEKLYRWDSYMRCLLPFK